MSPLEASTSEPKKTSTESSAGSPPAVYPSSSPHPKSKKRDRSLIASSFYAADTSPPSSHATRSATKSCSLRQVLKSAPQPSTPVQRPLYEQSRRASAQAPRGHRPCFI